MFHSPNTDLFELNKFTFTNFFTTFSQKKTWENVFSTKIRLWRIFSLPFFNFQKGFAFEFSHYLSFHRKKKLWKCFDHVTLWIIFDRFPGYFQLYFSICNRSIFFPHKVFTENLVKMFRFVSVTSLHWLATVLRLTEVLQSVSVLRPEQSAMRLLRSHWKAQQILSNANWVIKRFLC